VNTTCASKLNVKCQKTLVNEIERSMTCSRCVISKIQDMTYAKKWVDVLALSELGSNNL